jgi:hypothetical protein
MPATQSSFVAVHLNPAGMDRTLIPPCMACTFDTAVHGLSQNQDSNEGQHVHGAGKQMH